MNRREFITGLGLAGAAAFLPDRVLRGQTAAVTSGNPRRLDMHHHFGSPRWILEMNAKVPRQNGRED